ncbi:hypothetical protein VNO77_17608 [Canavalia gladiata]|uniref:Uncharacterized protein n=1 Tax=Canavalia gladiata TaxID=3824 RepID=A0AAN9LJA5_CANGL
MMHFGATQEASNTKPPTTKKAIRIVSVTGKYVAVQRKGISPPLVSYCCGQPLYFIVSFVEQTPHTFLLLLLLLSLSLSLLQLSLSLSHLAYLRSSLNRRRLLIDSPKVSCCCWCIVHCIYMCWLSYS